MLGSPNFLHRTEKDFKRTTLSNFKSTPKSKMKQRWRQQIRLQQTLRRSQLPILNIPRSHSRTAVCRARDACRHRWDKAVQLRALKLKRYAFETPLRVSAAGGTTENICSLRVSRILTQRTLASGPRRFPVPTCRWSYCNHSNAAVLHLCDFVPMKYSSSIPLWVEAHRRCPV